MIQLKNATIHLDSRTPQRTTSRPTVSFVFIRSRKRAALRWRDEFGTSSLAPEPLKRCRLVSIHRFYRDLLDTDDREARRQLVNPSPLMVPQHDPFRQLKDPVHAILCLRPPIPLDIPLIMLQPEVAEVQQSSPPKDPLHLSDDPSLPFITRDAGEHGEEQDSVH
jgi:hypothetical protein